MGRTKTLIISILFSTFWLPNANAAIIYELSYLSGGNPLVSLVYETPSFVEKNGVDITDQVTSCFSTLGDCYNVYFSEDLGLDRLLIAVSTPQNYGITYTFYFPLGTFMSTGITNTQYSPDATLSVVDTNVPIPAAVWLFGSGLLGLVGIARRKKAA